MKSLRHLISEAKNENKTAVFTYGRMNPPTTGHEKLMNELAKKSGKNSYRVYLSQSMDEKKNKLDIPALQLEDIENWSV